VQSNRLLKESIAAVYETDAFNSFLKEILHPGGLELTRKVAETALVNENSKVLDMACGRGESSLLLVEKYGCRVVGIDISDKKTTLAQSRARARGLDDRVKFITADAESLPFRNITFNTIISECSFSILPNKEAAALEMSRVLKPCGRLVITDMTLQKTDGNYRKFSLADSPFIPCLAGARLVEEYVSIFEGAGFHEPCIEDYSALLKRIGYQIGIKFGGWEGFQRQLSAELGLATKAVPRLAGKFGYVLIAMRKR
jgi:arsenite methyltransferase